MTTFINRAKVLLRRSTPEPAPKAIVAAKKAANAHHAVSIVPGPACCGAARRLQGTRFLSREAPVLPLKECTRGDCVCHYAHHDDRRRAPRRARDLGVAMDGWVEEDRRGGEKRGRRKTDRRGS